MMHLRVRQDKGLARRLGGPLPDTGRGEAEDAPLMRATRADGPELAQGIERGCEMRVTRGPTSARRLGDIRLRG